MHDPFGARSPRISSTSCLHYRACRNAVSPLYADWARLSWFSIAFFPAPSGARRLLAACNQSLSFFLEVHRRLHFCTIFPPEQPHKFASIHKIFGASNISKLLNGVHKIFGASNISKLLNELQFVGVRSTGQSERPRLWLRGSDLSFARWSATVAERVSGGTCRSCPLHSHGNGNAGNSWKLQVITGLRYRSEPSQGWNHWSEVCTKSHRSAICNRPEFCDRICSVSDKEGWYKSGPTEKWPQGWWRKRMSFWRLNL